MKKLLVLLLCLAPLSLRAETSVPPAAADFALPVFSIAPEDIVRASVELTPDGSARLTIRLTTAKTEAFAAFTAKNKGNAVKLVVGGQVLSQPTMHETITSGSLSWPYANADAAFDEAKSLIARQPEEPDTDDDAKPAAKAPPAKP